MIVCICHSITESDIFEAVMKGASDLDSLRAKTGCATGCGSCADTAIETLKTYLQNQVSSNFLETYVGSNQSA